MKRARSSWKAKIVVGLLWLNFGFFWLRVYNITTLSDVMDSVNYLGALISAYGLIVAWWIFHNIRIYRTRKGRTARQVPFMNTHDTLQRYISRKVDLEHEQEILVDVIGDRKVFMEARGAHATEPVTAR